MATALYAFPLDKLLMLGDARPTKRHWPDYRQYGLTVEHIPDLIRMATDDELNTANSQSAEVWAPTHARRALGQLRAESAAEPLTSLFHLIDDNGDDMVNEELPEVLGLIGSAAIPAVAEYLADASHGLWARVAAASSLKEIGQRHPDARAECVALLTRQLEYFADQDDTLNADLVGALLDLKAVESAPVMERAFAAGRVELSVAGDWEEVQVELGLLEKRKTPRPNFVADSLGPELGPKLKALAEQMQSVQPPPQIRKSKAKKRDKRKQQEPRGKKRR
jgi:hypothetical protein